MSYAGEFVEATWNESACEKDKSLFDALFGDVLFHEKHLVLGLAQHLAAHPAVGSVCCNKVIAGKLKTRTHGNEETAVWQLFEFQKCVLEQFTTRLLIILQQSIIEILAAGHTYLELGFELARGTVV